MRQPHSRPSLAPPSITGGMQQKMGQGRSGGQLKFVHAREISYITKPLQREKVHSSVKYFCVIYNNHPTPDIPQKPTSEPVIQMCLSSIDSHQTIHVGEATEKSKFA